MDLVFLPAAHAVLPVRDSSSMPRNAKAEECRVRDEQGRLTSGKADLRGRFLSDIVQEMGRIIQDPENDLGRFKGFFFWTWAAGMKRVLDHRRELYAAFPEIEWPTVDPRYVAIDHGVEVSPDPSLNPALVGVFARNLPSRAQDQRSHDHLRELLSSYGGGDNLVYK